MIEKGNGPQTKLRSLEESGRDESSDLPGADQQSRLAADSAFAHLALDELESSPPRRQVDGRKQPLPHGLARGLGVVGEQHVDERDSQRAEGSRADHDADVFEEVERESPPVGAADHERNENDRRERGHAPRAQA